jgi:hypothetical protein
VTDLLNAAAASLLLAFQKEVAQGGEDTLREVARKDGTYIGSDVKLAEAVVQELGAAKAFEMAAEYMGPTDRVSELFNEFRDLWEADPFGDPDTREFLIRAKALGEVASARFGGMLEVYVLYGPMPKYTAEQRAESRRKVEAAIERAEGRIANDPLARLQSEMDREPD